MPTRIISAEDVITGLYDTFADFHDRRLPEGIDPDSIGILTSLRVDINNYGYDAEDNHHPEWERQKNFYIHTVVVSWRRVFVAVSEEFDWRRIPLKDFINTSNHDSCWRSDGLSPIWREWHKGIQECWDHMPKELRHKSLDSTYATFSNLNDIVCFVAVEHEEANDETRRYGGRRQLTSLKERRFKIVFED